MYLPDDFLRDVMSAFDRYNLQAFFDFLRVHSGNDRWLLTSDYNWRSPGRPQDVIAFCLYPPFEREQAYILKEYLPVDFKKTKRVSMAAQHWFHSGAAFHICFVLEKEASFFHSSGANRLHVVRESLEATIAYLERSGAPIHILSKHKDIFRLSKSPGFKVRLWGDVLLLSICFAFIAGLLAREDRLQRLLWCSDRDALTSWNGGVLYDIALIQAIRFGHKFGHKLNAEHFPVLDLAQDSSAESYDHVIRPPDYLAGGISAWSIRDNSTKEKTEKYSDVLNGIILNNPNIAHIHVKMGVEHMQISGLVPQEI